MNLKNIANIAKIIFRKNLTSISLTGNVIDVYLKDLDNNEVKRFKNDCNEVLFKQYSISTSFITTKRDFQFSSSSKNTTIGYSFGVNIRRITWYNSRIKIVLFGTIN